MLQKADFDIGSLFYIIITLVAVIAGAFGKKKKPGAKPSGSGVQSKIEGFFNKLGVQLEAIVDDPKSSGQSFDEELIPGTSDLSSQIDEIDYKEFYEQSMDGLVEKDRPFSDYEGTYDPNEIENSALIMSEARRTTEDSMIADVIDLDDPSETVYFEGVKDFDLQKAVIYSIILNRIEY